MELYTKDNYNGYYLAIEEKIDKTYPLTGEISRKEVFDELEKLTEGDTELINDYINDTKYVKSYKNQNDLVVIQVRMVGEGFDGYFGDYYEGDFDGEFDWCVARVLYDIVEHKLYENYNIGTKPYQKYYKEMELDEIGSGDGFLGIYVKTDKDVDVLKGKLKQNIDSEKSVLNLMNYNLHYGVYLFDDEDDFIKNHKKGDNGISAKMLRSGSDNENVSYFYDVMLVIESYYDKCKDCFNCVHCKNCNGCMKCDSCYRCENCEDCIECNNCKNCWKCYVCDDCDGCENCEACDRCVNCVDCENCEDEENLKKKKDKPKRNTYWDNYTPTSTLGY